MFQTLQVLALVLVSVAMALALAHAAELPGKLRLSEDAYKAVQPIYYPGFTIGAFSEPASILALVALLALTSPDSPAFGWTTMALACVVAMHLVYWTVTHPVNRYWLKGQTMKGAGTSFFSFGQKSGHTTHQAADWRKLRDRWEHSHVVRAGVAMLGLILLAIAVTCPERA